MELIAGQKLREHLHPARIKQHFVMEPTKPLVENLIDPEIQIQMNGVDLTLGEIFELAIDSKRPYVDFTNERRKLPNTVELSPIIDFINIKGIDTWSIGKGTYIVRFNEIINIPSNVFAIARPRSTLLRSWMSVETAVWDSGYSGRSEAQLTVSHPAGAYIEKNARLIQILFFEIDFDVDNPYSGIFQNENILNE